MCYSNKLVSIDVSLNTNLEVLNLLSNQLASLDISGNTNLVVLDCVGNQITSLDFSKNPALNSVNVDSNQLTSIDVSINTNLKILNIGYNKLTTIDVSNNVALRSLSCHGNQLTSIDVSKNTNLINLEISYNKIASFDLSNNIKLETLGCSGNTEFKLNSIDISKNTKLVYLALPFNNLTSLDLGNNPNLETIYAYYNQIASIDVSNLPNLKEFYITQNHLGCIQVSHAQLYNIPINWTKDEITCYSEDCASLFPVPTITSFNPSSASKGETINILGTNFTGASKVDFGGTPATSFKVGSSTSISAIVGEGTSGNISITASGGLATISGFQFITYPKIKQLDSLALVALYNTTDGPNWTKKANWLIGQVKNWEGVTVEGSRVVKIDLRFPGFPGLKGTLPQELSNLTAIRELNLSDNQLTGSLPDSWSALVNLQSLQLSMNLLTGTLPYSWSSLVNLTLLNLSGNQFTGALPDSWSALVNLQQLYLANNQLTGTPPDSWSALVNLYNFFLSNNQISGTLPESWSAFVNLQFFALNNNKISGLPDLSSLSNLNYLQVENNSMDFGDIEPNMIVPKYGFYYSPQAVIGESGTITKNQGQEFRISVTVGGNSNKYQWYKNGVSITGATGTEFVITSVTSADAGIFTCQITNTVATELVLTSNSLTLQIANQKQEIALSNGWNIISANVIPDNTDLKAIFQTLIDAGKIKKVMDETGKTLENFGAFGGWKNNIGNLTATKGYKVNVTAASTLSLEGIPVQLPLDIALNTGWNIISYPNGGTQDAKALFQTLIDAGKLKKVMDETGKTIENFGAFGGWKNNIGNFTPGKGYKVNVTANCTLTIPASVIKSAIVMPELLASEHFPTVFIGSGTDHMNVHLVNLQKSGLQAGDEIGIFDGKLCVGSATIGIDQIADGSISIAASANDELTRSTNGYQKRHLIELRLFRGSQAYELNLEKLSGSESFETNGSLFAQVNLNNLTALQVTDNSAQFSCYPNPFTREITIEIQNPFHAEITVEIYNLVGQRIKSIFKGTQADHLVLKWNGTNDTGQKVAPGVYLCKVNGQSKQLVFEGKKIR